MLAIIPHHKGTDKLIAQLRRRLSQHKEEAKRRPSTSRQADPFTVKKEGAAQVVLVGLPNCGKSQILASLTNALPLIADYPFSTRLPLPGMMKFENIQIQIVDSPPLMDEFAETGIFNLIRNANALMVVLDLTEDCSTQIELILRRTKSPGGIKDSLRKGKTKERKLVFFIRRLFLLVIKRIFSKPKKIAKNF